MLRFLWVALEIHPLVLNKSTTGCVHQSCAQPEATLPKIHWACTAWGMIIVTKDKANGEWFSRGNKAALLLQMLPFGYDLEICQRKRKSPEIFTTLSLPFQWNPVSSSSFPAPKPGNWEIGWAEEASEQALSCCTVGNPNLSFSTPAFYGSHRQNYWLVIFKAATPFALWQMSAPLPFIQWKLK